MKDCFKTNCILILTLAGLFSVAGLAGAQENAVEFEVIEE